MSTTTRTITSEQSGGDGSSGRRYGPRPVLWKVPEAMGLLNIRRSVIYEQIRSGRLRTVKVGRTRLVPDAAIGEYVTLLEAEAAG